MAGDRCDGGCASYLRGLLPLVDDFAAVRGGVVLQLRRNDRSPGSATANWMQRTNYKLELSARYQRTNANRNYRKFSNYVVNAASVIGRATALGSKTKSESVMRHGGRDSVHGFTHGGNDTSFRLLASE